MEMQFIKASNGKTYTVPADWDDERIYEHIKSQIKGPENTGMGNTEQLVSQDANLINQGKRPVNSKPNKSSSQIAMEKFHDALRNLGAGTGNSIQNAAQGLKPLLGLSDPNLLNADEKNNINFEDLFRVRQKNPTIQGIPEAASYFVPGLGTEKALSKAPALARGLGTIAEQGAVQGGLSYLLNPEHRFQSGAKTAGAASGMQAIINAMTSRHPGLKAARYLIPRLTGSVAGEESARLAGLPPSARALGAILGLATGAGAGRLASKLVGRNVHGEEYAKDVYDALKDMGPEEASALQQKAKNIGVHLTPGELTQSPIVKAKEKSAGVNKENIRQRHALEEARKNKEQDINVKFKEGVYNQKEHEHLLKQAQEAAKPKKVPVDILPKEHGSLYQKASEFAKSNPELSAEFAKSAPGSIGRYDVIRRALDKMIKSEKGTKTNLLAARKDLSDALKDFSPDYKTWMNYGERAKVVEDINKIQNQSKLTGENFFELISDNKKLADRIKHTENVEGAEQFLKDAHDVYARRKSVNTTSLASKMNEAGIPLSKEEAGTFMKRFFGGKADKEMIKMMHDPDLMSKLHMMVHGGNIEKSMVEFAKILGKKKSQDIAKEK
jgi:hypothetical protein